MEMNENVEELKDNEEISEEFEQMLESNDDEDKDEQPSRVFNYDDSTKAVDIMRAYLDDASYYPLLTKEEEYDLFKKFNETGDIKYKQEIANHNTRLVVNIAKHYTSHGLDMADIIQEGNLGLLRAIDTFDISKDFRFSTYATWWIKQAIARGIMNSGRAIRVPCHVLEANWKYRKFLENWKAQGNSGMPSDEEIMDALKITQATLLQLKQASMDDPVSLNTLIGEDEDSTLEEFIPDNNNLSIEKTYEQQALRDTFEDLFQNLKPKEIEIIKMRFGFDGEPKTLEECGKYFGVTRERIRQIESKAIRKLRHPKRLSALKPYLEE